jgi:hypothetical protein
MKFIVFKLILFFTIQCANAQQSQTAAAFTSVLSHEEFIKAKDLFLKMSNSDAYKSSREGTKLFVRKMKKVNIGESDKTDEAFLEWISKNLSRTSFKSIEEAVTLRKSNIDATAKMWEENQEFYEIFRRASKEQALELYKPYFYVKGE